MKPILIITLLIFVIPSLTVGQKDNKKLPPRAKTEQTLTQANARLTLGLIGYGLSQEPKDAKDAEAHFNKGKAYYLSGHYREAIEAFKHAISLKSDFVMAHYSLGLAYYSLGQYEEAIGSFKEALHLKPDWAEVYNNLGLAFRKMDRYSEALQAYNEAIRLKPDWAIPFFNRGAMYTSTGKYEEAIDSYKQVIRLQPDLAEAHNNLGVAYMKSGRSWEAVDPLQEAVRLKADWAEPRNNLGVAYLKTLQLKEAVEPLKEAIRIKPDWAQPYLNLAVAYLGLGERERATEQYNILKTLDQASANYLYKLLNEQDRPIFGGVLNGKALSLPKPMYPAIARSAHAGGVVAVKVIIDEAGNVIAAEPVSGHPLLRAEAVTYARLAKFSPTKLEGRPIKVTGIITYNFIPDNVGLSPGRP